ncbi:MAG: penicillin-binding protein activator [Stagnimonas sp.]|nr:penicillin-binding protein activator [Stagnimonas sp.]
MKSAPHRVALLALALSLAAPVRAESPANQAQAAMARGDYREASQFYLAASQAAPGGVHAEYLLLAAEALRASGDYAGVEAILRRLPPASLEGLALQRAGLLRAEARMAQGDPSGALALLPLKPDPSLASPILDLRAQAQFASGEVLAGTASRVAREQLLPESERAGNRQRLWTELGRAELAPPAGSGDPRVSGWIELSRLAREGAPLSAYELWRRRYPGHPGEAQLPGLFMPAAVAGELSTLGFGAAPPPPGRDLALLLPLSGPLAAAAQAIHAGAEAARSQAGEDAPSLRVYDSQPGLGLAVAAAMESGAGLLIGPLRKEDVAALAAQPPQRPTLALNYLDAGRVPPAGFTPFGLAPEDEARAAAAHAMAEGHSRAVLLVQDGDWGERIAQAFRGEFESRGGSVVAEARFRANTVDFSATLKPLLGLDAAEARRKQLAAIGIRAEFEPRPRGDIDTLFIGARAAQAKLIWPQLRFYRAGRLASYAPAAAADAGAADLGGLRVCDAPWRLASQGELAELRGRLATVNPRSADAQRLFALGYDAYRIAQQMLERGLPPGDALPGLSGTLVIDADAALHRRLDCVALVAPDPVVEDGE